MSQYNLFCGSPATGVIHIDAEHPIADDGADDINVRNCFGTVLGEGDEVPAAEGNSAYAITNAVGGTATVVVDNITGEGVTMFTSDGLGNNWAACAAL